MREHVISPVMEAAGIPWEGATLYVNPTGRFVVGGPLPKSNRSNRDVTIPEGTVEFLRHHKQMQPYRLMYNDIEQGEDTPVFCSDLGELYRPSKFTSDFSRFAQHKSFDLTLHGTRHTHASLLLKKGVPIQYASSRLSAGRHPAPPSSPARWSATGRRSRGAPTSSAWPVRRGMSTPARRPPTSASGARTRRCGSWSRTERRLARRCRHDAPRPKPARRRRGGAKPDSPPRPAPASRGRASKGSRERPRAAGTSNRQTSGGAPRRTGPSGMRRRPVRPSDVQPRWRHWSPGRPRGTPAGATWGTRPARGRCGSSPRP